MADVFISYAEEDRELVRGLVKAIEAAGWSVFWDRTIPTGKTWRAVLDAALVEMKCMVVVWSAAATRSDWVIEEADEGKSRGVLLPINIEASRPPPRGFRQIQTLDFTAWDRSPNAACVSTLVADIRGFIGEHGNHRSRIRDPWLQASASSDCIATDTVRFESERTPHRIDLRRAILQIKGVNDVSKVIRIELKYDERIFVLLEKVKRLYRDYESKVGQKADPDDLSYMMQAVDHMQSVLATLPVTLGLATNALRQ